MNQLISYLGNQLAALLELQGQSLVKLWNMIILLWPKFPALIPCLLVNETSWHDCVTIQNEVSMVDMNVENVYKEEWYDSVSGNEIDIASVVKEMIDVRNGSVKCEIFNIDDVEFIINDQCIN